MNHPTALIAEDEPLLAQHLQAELARAWPQLHVAALVGDGASAVEQALALRPNVLFLDIRMPGLSGLEAAAELADAWPEGAELPLLVFVTAYDQYAVEAFEQQAVDYVLKPVQPARLDKTVARAQAQLALRAMNSGANSAPPEPGGDAGQLSQEQKQRQSQAQTFAQLRALLAGSGGAASQPAPPLRTIQASVGSTVHMVPVAEVLVLEAADKYVRVLTAEREYLIRTPLRELLPRLDAQQFVQIHRGTVVQAAAIASVMRDDAGKQWVHLRGSSERLAVSRLYAHLFKAM